MRARLAQKLGDGREPPSNLVDGAVLEIAMISPRTAGRPMDSHSA